jgi:subfamily B ATP-binding cassette protein MsbA
VVKAYSLETWQIGRFREIFRTMGRLGIKSMQAKELLNPIVETISMFGLGAVIVVIFISHTTVSNLVGFLTGVAMIFTPVKKLGGIHNYFTAASVSAMRLVDLFNEKPSVQEKPDAKPLARFSQGLTLENVSFSYDGKKTVLSNVNLNIPRGCKLGVAGESGSGKSTLTTLLLRFYDPVEGAIKMDGRNLRDISFDDLRGQMALMTQDVVVFDQTVAGNIACGKLDATREQIIAAAKEAYAHDFITHLPEGYDTRVGERGITLSGGQRQRLAIARAFVRNAPILILDEATAALDSASEAEVQATIDRLAENRTLVCIAHRLSTLKNCDRVVVFSQGKIIEEGTFDGLLRAGGVFADMARRQGIQAERVAG